MEKIKRIELYKRAMSLFGFESQLSVLGEESSELAVDIFKYQNKKATISKLLEEVADVEIMIEQMRLYFGDSVIDEIKNAKLQRFASFLESKSSKA